VLHLGRSGVQAMRLRIVSLITGATSCGAGSNAIRQACRVPSPFSAEGQADVQLVRWPACQRYKRRYKHACAAPPLATAVAAVSAHVQSVMQHVLRPSASMSHVCMCASAARGTVVRESLS
jgi:hypothetical protein